MSISKTSIFLFFSFIFILDGVNSNNRYNRLEALELYEKLARDKDIDKSTIERYEKELKVGSEDERNVYDELFKVSQKN